ncbi:aspartic peptidase A1 [Amanita muscaria]
MFSKTLLSTLLLALAVAANPIVSREPYAKLQLSRQLNTTGVYNVLQHDQARAAHLAAKASAKKTRAVYNEPVTNEVVTYMANVGVGTPPTFYSLIVDTGSSNTWVGATKAYVKTSSSVATADKVAVTYGSGSFSGNEYFDTVTIGSLVIQHQSIGVATTSTGFTGTDGIIGIGPVDLTVGTLSPDTNTAIPTVTDNAYSQGSITADQIGISFEPTTSTSVQNGELTWGGVDSTKYTGAITYTPVTTTFPASYYWGINESITYGTTTVLASTAGIVDTGTTLILIASNAFATYKSLTGGVLDANTGLLKITASQYSALKPLNFNINGVTFPLTANAQIWPRSLNTAIGGTATSIYLVVASIGAPSGQGLDFIDGYTFLERYYSVFDTANKRVGFATTSFTTATTN